MPDPFAFGGDRHSPGGAASHSSGGNNEKAASDKDVYADLTLVSHQQAELVLDSPEIVLTLHCPAACAFRASLLCVRGSGTKEEVKRATLVMRFEAFFLVRVKVPIAPAKYVLVFKFAKHAAPETFIEHPFKYSLSTSEFCSCLMSSLEHPLVDIFGYALQPPAAQVNWASIICPTDYRVAHGYVYFAVCIDPKSPLYPKASRGLNDPPVLPTATRLFSHRLKAQKPPSRHERSGSKELGDGSPGSLRRKSRFAKRRTTIMRPRGSGTGIGSDSKALSRLETKAMEGAKCAVGVLHELVRKPMQPYVQDAAQLVHVDISVLHFSSAWQRYCVRLRQRPDFKTLYDGLLYFADVDVDCKVEMHLSYPGAHNKPDFAPLKIGEWVVIKKEEMLPEGF